MVTIDSKDIEAARKSLSHISNGIERAISAAINHSLGKAKTSLKRKVREEYFIKDSDVEKTLKTKKSTISTLSGTIISTSTRTALSKFNVKTSSSGLTVAIKKGTGRVPVTGKPILYGKPFLAKFKTGHIGVMQRKTEKKQRVAKGEWKSPMQELFTLSIPQMLGNPSVQNYIEEYASDLVQNRFYHEVDRLIRGIK
ncbi:phage tail protein [Fusobacterium mortiferum]|jgi:hypothetical protein|uniref:Uncharacterized protein n=1 Tax=Fusobacterium mortiferum TaxID=850 RepID=A0A414PRF9_FUSMR|nr:phage tail protein [Fusobacterium mortiferum]MCI6381335.1 phage tail protein [Fusobacterium mortiferum]RHF71081.1 hypothetical protein DW663_09185 [Fusobacterium mortiferum]DAP91403.1 MAG TPA: minor tail protein Z [Caudoviricetes sp.]